MNQLPNSGSDQNFSINVKDLVAIGFRHQRAMLLCFLAVFCGAVMVGILMPTSYQAHTKTLIKRERVDPVISPGQNAQVMVKDVDPRRAKVGSDREVSAFVELARFKTRPAPVNVAAFHRAAEHEHDVAMPVIGATVSVFTRGATKLRAHHQANVTQAIAHVRSKSRQRLPKL